jgi:cobalt-zinc-cadmium resistance protein CzcA
LVGSGWNLDKTQLYYNSDENNIAENGLPLNVLGISQVLQFPTIYGAQRKVEKQKVELTTQQYRLNERVLTKEVYAAYYEVVYSKNLVKQYIFLDSLYGQFARAANKRYTVGETNLLENH